MDFSDLDTSLKVTLPNVTLYSNWLYNNRLEIQRATNRSNYITSRIGFVESNKGAIISFLKKTGLVTSSLEVSPLAILIAKEELLYRELCLIHLSKESLFLNGQPKVNLITLLSTYVGENDRTTYDLKEIRNFDLSFQVIEGNRNSNNRTDYILTLLEGTDLFVHQGRIDDGIISLSSNAKPILDYFSKNPIANNEDPLNSANRFDYFSSLEGGVFSILTDQLPSDWIDLYPHLTLNNIRKIKNTFNSTYMEETSKSLQQIFYGAPGTGKSHEIKKLTEGHSVIRTTFHPDSDYSTFVGCYKPSMEDANVRVVPVVVDNGISLEQNNGTYKEKRITYKFVIQAFLKAYLGAWKKYTEADDGEINSQFLIIEEINRGNCAQIFGDLFQLLDRGDNNFSEYPIEADTDLQQEIEKAFKEHKDYKLEKNISADEAVEDYISNYNATLSEDIQNGRVLLLPPNLYIWATMNTSDQSLFPIDSAFKRRWDWRYIKIAEGKDKDTREPLGWTVRFDYDEDNGQFTFECSWWEFVKAINEKIAEATSSDDKKLGYFFCKPKDKNSTTIDEERFVSKVVFYLWNDVFKDEENRIFKVNESKGEPSFDTFYKENEEGQTVVDTKALRTFMHNVFVDNKDLYTETAHSDN